MTTQEKYNKIQQYLALHPDHGRDRISSALGIHRSSVCRCLDMLKKGVKPAAQQESHDVSVGMKIEYSKDAAIANSCGTRIKTLKQLLDSSNVDQTVWEVEKHTINKWEVAMREPATTVGGRGDKAVKSIGRNGEMSTLWTRGSHKPLHEEMVQIKVWLKRKAPQILAGQVLLEKLAKNAPILKVPRVHMKQLSHNRALELCIMDPHIGLMCQQPEADEAWDIDRSAAVIMTAIEDLIAKAEKFGPFEQAFMPFGNDFIHADNVFHTTTAGTGQPEAIAWHHVYERAEGIAIAMVERIRQCAKKLYIYQVPGNHSRMADFTLAHMLRAYFRNDPNIFVNASSSPYKFHRFGTNLIGYEHGHSVSQIRLAALMANECGSDYAETQYREWHLGDQHRKGSSNPAAMEEQGVSVEFIPGLTAPNEWHRLKAFNHQKQGAMAFVYDHDTGPIMRLQHNIQKFHKNQIV